MSQTEPQETSEIPDSRRIRQFRAKLSELTNTDRLAEMLYLDRDLSRTEFDAKVIELGYRAALRNLAALACTGDTKALDLFLKRCDQYFSQRHVAAPTEDAPASPYTRPEREAG